MRAVTLKEAKARLNALVDAALAGEEIVLMRGSRHVAAIVPLAAEELELPARLTDAQAARFWRGLAAERLLTFDSVEKAVSHLDTGARPRRKRGR